MAGSSDIPPASPGTLDDEFDTTDTSDPMTGWTTRQTPTTHNINSFLKSHYYVKRTAVATSAGHVGIEKNWTPSAGQYCSTKLTDCVIARSGNQVGAALWVTDGTKFEMIRVIYDSTFNTLRVTAYNTVGAPTSDLAGIQAPDRQAQGPVWFRVRYNSSTSIDWLVSFGGIFYSPVLLARNPGFTISQVGIGLDTQNTALDGEAVFDYFRSSF